MTCDLYFRGEERQLKQGITQQGRLLATYKSSEQDTMNKYGQNMGAVVRDIQQQRDRFHKLPRGPLGVINSSNYVDHKKYQYSSYKIAVTFNNLKK